MNRKLFYKVHCEICEMMDDETQNMKVVHLQEKAFYKFQDEYIKNLGSYYEILEAMRQMKIKELSGK